MACLPSSRTRGGGDVFFESQPGQRANVLNQCVIEKLMRILSSSRSPAYSLIPSRENSASSIYPPASLHSIYRVAIITPDAFQILQHLD